MTDDIATLCLLLNSRNMKGKLSSRKTLLLLAIRGYPTLRRQHSRLRHFYIRFLQWILRTKQQAQTNGRYAKSPINCSTQQLICCTREIKSS